MRTVIKIIMAFVFLIVCPHTYSADFARPPRFPLEVVPTPTIKSTPASSIMFGSIIVDFDKTTLYEAMKQIKAGNIQHEGDAGESAYWLCYSIRTPERWEQLWLLSHGEMGGDEHVIHGVVANISSSSPSLSSCPELPNNLRHVKLNNGLWLGAKSEEIRKKLGKPSFQQNQWLYYESQRELPGDPRVKDFGTNKIYERGSLSVREAKGKVVEIWATKQVTD